MTRSGGMGFARRMKSDDEVYRAHALRLLRHATGGCGDCHPELCYQSDRGSIVDMQQGLAVYLKC